MTQQDNQISKILLVDDNVDGQILVKKILSHYNVDIAGTVLEARKFLESSRYDLVLLDVNLPDGDGFSFLHEPSTKELLGDATLFYLTARSNSDEKVTGFDLGADDYITKPFDVAEFKARIDAHLRKRQLKDFGSSPMKIGNILLDLSSQTAQIADEQNNKISIELTTLEFRILLLFAKNQDRPIRREEILQHIWGKSTNVIERTLDSHVSNLRKKLKPSSMTIQSVYGIGYRFFPKVRNSLKPKTDKAS